MCFKSKSSFVSGSKNNFCIKLKRKYFFFIFFTLNYLFFLFFFILHSTGNQQKRLSVTNYTLFSFNISKIFIFKQEKKIFLYKISICKLKCVRERDNIYKEKKNFAGMINSPDYKSFDINQISTNSLMFIAFRLMLILFFTMKIL